MGLTARSDELMANPPPPLRLVGHRPGRRTRAPRRAKTVVLWTLASFVVVQSVLTWFLFGKHPGVDYWTRLELIRQRTGARAGNPFTVFIVGSSRSQLGVRASQLETVLSQALHRPVVAISFSTAGAGPMTELFSWRRLQRDGCRPDLLLVEVLPCKLTAAQKPAFELHEAFVPLAHLGWADLSLVEHYASEVRPKIRRDWLRSALNPIWHGRLEFLSRYAPQFLPPGNRIVSVELDSSGQSRMDDESVTTERRDKGIELARDTYLRYLEDFQTNDHPPGGGYELFRELLSSCREDGVATAILLMPEGPVFRSWYPPDLWDRFRSGLDDLAAEQNSSVVDVREWMGEEEFYDSHHLTFRSATRFTERLAREKLAPLLRTLRPGPEPPGSGPASAGLAGPAVSSSR